jgi:Lamin Tail Domain
MFGLAAWNGGGWTAPRDFSAAQRQHKRLKHLLGKGMQMKRTWIKLAGVACLSLLAGAAHGQVVISQVYGGGGNSGAPYHNDYIELYNKGAGAVNITGWSVQYASATGAFSASLTTALTGTIQPHSYYLVQQAAGTGGGAALPTPDATGTVNMSGTAGKVALVNTTTPITTCTQASVVDLVGFGATASCFEGSGPTPAPSNTTAALRGSNGCDESNNNATDFSAGAPNPRNSASPTFTCPVHTPPSGVGSTNPASVCPGSPVVLFLTVTPGANPPSTGINVTVDTTNIGGFGVEQMYNDGTHGDAVAGDNIWTTTSTVFVSGPSTRSLACVLTDAQGGNGAATITVNVLNGNPSGFVLATPSGLCAGESTLVTCSSTTGCGGSPIASVTVDLSQIGGSPSQQLFDDGSNGDATAGDGLFSYLYALPSGVADGNYTVTATLQDGNGNTSAQLTAPVLTSSTCNNSASTLVVSQVYGGGGNTGATYTHDFVELFNRGSTPVSLSGMSIQYASGENDAVGLGGSNRFTILPAATVQPGQYFLVQEAPGAGGTTPLPTPDFAPGENGDTQVPIAMSLNRGTIALVNGTSPLGLTCSDPSILDMVGYGNTLVVGQDPNRGFCHEGPTPPPYYWAPTLDNTHAAFRRDGGCHDVDNNGVDFYSAAPAPRNSASPLNLCSGAPNFCCLADYDGDGDVGTDFDIQAFFACLGGNCCATCPPDSDFNCDGDAGTDADIESFFRVLAGGNC